MSEREAREIVNVIIRDVMAESSVRPGTRLCFNDQAWVESIAAALDARVEACCRAVCYLCTEGIPVTVTHAYGRKWWVHSFGGGDTVRCGAQLIRAAFPKEG